MKEKFCERGFNSDNVFVLVDEGRDDPNTTKSEPSPAHKRNTFRWRADDGPTLNAGLVAV